ncbi:PepSY domain-containing protein [Cytobacillus sp. FSL M8-0252]|uniref:PepSY domain-containing protein n=1 Tax=Cytobacillus TaxID=2675230 RepID=UPI001CD69DD7|nr:PepSY domain-containing protein [Cytobacillus kochii]MCA1026276.1 PepSY domain-containing protein [Cytobacillus kochii]
MKNKIFVGLIITGVIMGGAVAVGATNNDETNATSINTELDEKVSQAGEADVIAISKQDDGENQSDDRGYDDDNDDVQDVKVDASSGDSIQRDQDNEDDDIERDRDDANDDDKQLIKQRIIQEKDAIAIAEKASNGKVNEIELDEEDGLIVYEIEADSKKGEVEIEMNAKTGEIIKKDLD